MRKFSFGTLKSSHRGLEGVELDRIIVVGVQLFGFGFHLNRMSFDFARNLGFINSLQVWEVNLTSHFSTSL